MHTKFIPANIEIGGTGTSYTLKLNGSSITGGTTYTEGKGIDISDSNVISIESLGVDETCIANNSISENKLIDFAVTTNKIADGAITSDKIAEGTIDASILSDASIDASKLTPTNAPTRPDNDSWVNASRIDGPGTSYIVKTERLSLNHTFCYCRHYSDGFVEIIGHENSMATTGWAAGGRYGISIPYYLHNFNGSHDTIPATVFGSYYNIPTRVNFLIGSSNNPELMFTNTTGYTEGGALRFYCCGWRNVN